MVCEIDPRKPQRVNKHHGLYEDSVIGKLTDERFCEMSKGYEAESADLKTRIQEAQKAISSYKDTDSNSRRFAALMQKYFDVKELDAAMLNAIVQKVDVHEREIMNGEREQKIDIYYNFVGIISQKTAQSRDRRFRVKGGGVGE